MSTLVLGAGYAGVMAANRLAGHGHPVTLVTPHPWFVERIRLHAFVSGARPDARRALADLLDPAVDVALDTAVRIDDDVVHLASGAARGFETLVYAVGSGAPRVSRAHRIASLADAERLRDALAARPGARVTIVGAGLTGVELASVLREAGREVRIVTASVPQRRAAQAHLTELRRGGVDVETGSVVDVGSLDDSDIHVDTTGFTVPTLASDSGLPTDPEGRLLVDDTLTVPGHPRVLGAGDAVHVVGPRGAHLRPACATAMPMGAHAADVVHARGTDRDPEPFGLGYLAQCVDLGGGRGHVQLVRADDAERTVALTGRAGGLLKEAICRMTLRWLAQADRYTWPAPPAAAQ